LRPGGTVLGGNIGEAPTNRGGPVGVGPEDSAGREIVGC